MRYKKYQRENPWVEECRNYVLKTHFSLVVDGKKLDAERVKELLYGMRIRDATRLLRGKRVVLHIGKDTYNIPENNISQLIHQLKNYIDVVSVRCADRMITGIPINYGDDPASELKRFLKPYKIRNILSYF